VHFVPIKDPKLSSRYSILVKQYSLSQANYNYYRTLQEMSLSNNLFSQTQPGFLNGNIESPEGQNEVIGLFSVSSVSEHRIFFDYEDYHTNTDIVTYYANNCNIRVADIEGSEEEFRQLIDEIDRGLVKLVGIVPGSINYEVVETPCVDCRYWGDIEKPDFWED